MAFLALASSPAAAWDITLAWDPNTEANLDGYTVYYTKNAPGPPYDYVGDLPLNEMADPNRPSTSITNLERNISYYFALTAYDTDGNESSFSQQLCVRNDGNIYQCAPAATVSGSSSSGSGGCFVQATKGPQWGAPRSSLPVILIGLFMAIALLLPALNSKRS